MTLAVSNTLFPVKSLTITEELNYLLEWANMTKSDPSFLIQIKPHYSL